MISTTEIRLQYLEVEFEELLYKYRELSKLLYNIRHKLYDAECHIDNLKFLPCKDDPFVRKFQEPISITKNEHDEFMALRRIFKDLISMQKVRRNEQ